MNKLFDFIDSMAGKWLDWRNEKSIADDEHFELIAAHIDKRATEITLAHPSIAIMAQEAAMMLNESNAENYVQFDMMPRADRKLPWIRVTVQYAQGLSPAAKNAKLEAENKRLVESLTRVCDLHDGNGTWQEAAWAMKLEAIRAIAPYQNRDNGGKL